MKTLTLAALAVSLLLASCLAHGEPTLVPAFTAFSEPNPGGIDVRAGDGVYGWTDKTQSAVWYGDLRDLGVLTLAVKLTLPAGETARWRLHVSGLEPESARTQNFILPARVIGTGAEQTVSFGQIQVSRPGFYRLALEGVQKSGATFGDLKALSLDGPAAASIASKAGFNFTHWRGQTSTHLTYQFPKGAKYTAFYNEITPLTDPVHTYYCAIGFDGGYMGMQANTAREKRIIFSVWDNAKEAVSRAKVDAKDRAGLLAKGDKVFAGDFNNEGTGGHSHVIMPWKVGETQRFLVQVKPDGDAAIFAGYFFRPDTHKWTLVSAWRRPRTEAALTRFYSFSEDFGHDQQATRRAKFGPAWVQTADGHWTEPFTARFSRTAGGQPVRRDWQAGVAGDQFITQIGGYITGTTEAGDLLTRHPSAHPPTDLVLPALPDAMPPPAPEETLAPALNALSAGKNAEAAQGAQEIASGPNGSPAVKAMAAQIVRLTQPEPSLYPAPGALPATVKVAALSDLAWDSATVGYAHPLRDRSLVEGSGDFPLLRSGERIYEKGIFAHAPSRLVFHTAGDWKRFISMIGLQRGGGSAVFVVRGDGRELYRSSLLQNDETAMVNVDITGMKTLELVTEASPDGNGHAWSVWFDPQLRR